LKAINVFSPNWDKYDSYGIIANNLAHHADVHVNQIGLNSGEGQIIPSFGGLLLGYPTIWNEFGVMALLGKRVAVTMFESTKLPAGWVVNLNTCAAVIVPSVWVAEVFRNSGVIVPIHVVPLGVDPVYFDVCRQPRMDDRPYTFVCLGDRQTRKGWDLAWHAFKSAFGKREDVRLIIKCRKNGLDFINSGDANVQILRADLTHEAMAQFYAECDCMVFPTLGEGFGLPPREFAATGGPVLVTRFGGTADNLDEWGYGIPYKLVDAWPAVHRYPDKLQGCGQWAEPNVQVLTRQMKAIVDLEFPAFRSSMLRTRRIAELYDWSCFAKRVFEIYRSA
jgi:Glycosyltransferase